MIQPTVSVIVPVWNVEKYILRCLKSILAQKYRNIEIIIVDDCSPDNSIQIIQDFIESNHIEIHIKIISHSKNCGLGAARRSGILAAKGKYIIAIDSDDWIDEDYLDTVVSVAEQNNHEIVVTDYYGETIDNSHIYKQRCNKSGVELTKSIMAGKIQGFLWNKLIKRSLYTQNNIYPIIGIDMWEDINIICKLATQAHSIGYVAAPYYHYNLSNTHSYSTNRLSQKAVNSMFKAVEDLEEYFSHSTTISCDDLNRLKARAKVMAITMFENGLYKYAKIYPEIKWLSLKTSLKLFDTIILLLLDLRLSFLVYPIIKLKSHLKSVLNRD